jgi:ribosomal protein S12 methylthiotransferase
VSKVGFVSLGCPKALVDSERILTQLRVDGYDIVNSYNDADVVVVNTCGFIESARDESLETIGEAINENGKVIVTGCLGVHEDQIREAHPSVLSVTGPQQYEQVVTAVHKHAPKAAHNPYTDLMPVQGIKLTPRHYAYLKISEGCNHKCSFCIIPSMRGRLVSRAIGDVMREAEALAMAGVKELLVISQDTSAYGSDIKYQSGDWRGQTYDSNIMDLCRALGELGIWVRLHYVYPYPHVDKIIPLMNEGKVLPYLDVPFQHGSSRILKLMKRPAAAENTLQRINAWRDICSDITIRSTFIVGFPGESKEDFDELLGFLSEAQLDRVGCFKYSAVDGAKANELPDAVPEEVKEERWQRFMEKQNQISAKKLENKIGRTFEVLIDELNGNEAIGRSHADAPEIDGQVIIKNANKLKTLNLNPGDQVKVRIETSGDYDLWGKIAE